MAGLSDSLDYLGNKIDVGDLILYKDSDSPATARVVKCSSKRCYFDYSDVNKHGSWSVEAFRSNETVVSLTALGYEHASIYYGNPGNHRDMCGNDIIVGDNVLMFNGRTPMIGRVDKLTKQKCGILIIGDNEEKVVLKYPSHLLVISRPAFEQ